MTTTGHDGTGQAAPAPVDATPTPARPWYRRRAFLTSAAVAVVLAVTVLTDLPTASTKANDLKTAQGIVSEIETDAAPCNLGMTEALGFYADTTTGRITAAHRAQVPALIRDDLGACSFTNQSIVDLASINVPSNPTGRLLNAVASNVLTWCDPAALTTIDQITLLIEDKSTPAGRQRLVKDEQALTADRALAYRSIATLEHGIGSTDLTRIPLVAAP
ncbi:MAG: hypothetical protein ACYCTE_04300 [Acidimicrobiales bacterium]